MTRSEALLRGIAAVVLIFLVALFAGHAPVAMAGEGPAQSRNLAAGFSRLAPNATLLLMPTDIELFSISGGGVLEPRADWTEAAARHFKAALAERGRKLGVATVELSERDADEVEEVNALHGAIARSIAFHHFGPSMFHLPTKNGRLDWSLGETVESIRKRTGADYALFSWVRDSYASGERVATMIVLALFGIGVPGGMQTGYASLVDLRSGQVVWFNRLLRASGDLREATKAAETVDTLLRDFPGSR